MGNTHFQRTVFTVLICFLMVLGMTAYNMALANGFSGNFFITLLEEFWIGFLIALVIDILIVSNIAKPLAFRLIRKFSVEHMFAKIVIISSSMVIGMVFFMSIYGSILAVGFNTSILQVYPRVALFNFIVAWPLNILLVNPIARLIHINLFPQPA